MSLTFCTFDKPRMPTALRLQRSARLYLVSADFQGNRSSEPLHPNGPGDSCAGQLDVTVSLCLLEHLLSHLLPSPQPQGQPEAGVLCYPFSLGFS